MSPRAVFVAGAHTDVGKTYAACALIRTARAQGLTVEALKPVVSGFDPTDWEDSDPGRLLAALDRPLTPETLDAISPLRFRAPLSPPMAARLEGRALSLEALVHVCRAKMAETKADLLVVEGVGGLMSPVSSTATGLDLMVALNIPTVLVGGAYLGAISHTLTALAAARAAGVAISCVVVSQSADPNAPDFAQTVADTAHLATQVPVIAAPRGEAVGWPAEALSALG